MYYTQSTGAINEVPHIEGGRDCRFAGNDAKENDNNKKKTYSPCEIQRKIKIKIKRKYV